MRSETRRVAFEDVEVITGRPVPWCRDDTVGAIPPVQLLPGTEVRQPGDLGRLVLSEDIASDLGLLSRS